MSQDQYEYAIVSKTGGRVLTTFWAVPATQHIAAKKIGYDLRKVNIVKIYPRES